MKRKTVYLHIGSPKTGTSALQYFLLQNREVLHKYGIEYPKHLIDPNGISSGNAEQLVRYLKKDDIQKDDIQNARRFIEFVLNNDCERVVLSSEYFYRLQSEGIAVTKELLSGVDTKVIVYLRREDNVFISAYNQGVKRARRTALITAWYIKRLSNVRSAYIEVSKWSRICGGDNMIIRVYEKQQYAGGSVFSDFLHILNLELTDEYERPPRNINPAYRVDALEMMRLLNILPLTHEICSLDTLLQQYSEDNGSIGDWPYALLSAAERLEIINYYAEANERIACDYLARSDGRLFYDPLPDPDAPWESYPGLSEKDVRQIASYIADKDPITSQRIGRAIKQGLQSDDPAVRSAAQTLSAGLDIFMSKPVRIGDHAVFCGLACQNKMRWIYSIMPPRLKRPIITIARKLHIVR